MAYFKVLLQYLSGEYGNGGGGIDNQQHRKTQINHLTISSGM